MWSAIVIMGPNLTPSSCWAAATSWWCFSTETPISVSTDSISERMSWQLSIGGTGK